MNETDEKDLEVILRVEDPEVIKVDYCYWIAVTFIVAVLIIFETIF